MKVVLFRFPNLEFRRIFYEVHGIYLSSTALAPNPGTTCVAIQKGDHNVRRCAVDVHFLSERRGSPNHRRAHNVLSDTVSTWTTLSC